MPDSRPAPSSYAAIITARLAELGWTQQHLSEVSGVSVATIRHVVNGTGGTPQDRTLTALREALQRQPLQRGTSAETVAEHYRAAIRAGQWVDGQQLPSTRAVADEWGTSVATVSRAFALLADEGLVINRDRSSRVVSYSGAAPTGSLDDLTTAELADLAVRVTTELQRRLEQQGQ